MWKWNSKCSLCVVMVCVGFRGGDLFQQARQRAHFKRLCRTESSEWCSRSGLHFVSTLTERASLTLSSCIIFSEFCWLQRDMAVLIAKPRLLPFPPVSFIAHRSPCESAHYGCEHVKKLSEICKLFAWALEAEIQWSHHLLWMLYEQVHSNM